MKKFFKITFIVIGLLFLFTSSVFLYWISRLNTAYINPELDIEYEKVGGLGRHNAFTDLTYWKGQFFLTFRMAPSHGSHNNPQIAIYSAPDAQNWTLQKTFRTNASDIRDPHFGIVHDKLFVYIITKFDNGSLTTQYSYSINGTDWCSLQNVNPSGVRFWRPKTQDNMTWFIPSIRSNLVELWNSTDGTNWTKISIISDRPGADETEIEFSENGSLIATTRLQSSTILGDNSQTTLISYTTPPYESWSHEKSNITRLDGPILFSYNNKTFAIGRYQPESDNLFQAFQRFLWYIMFIICFSKFL
ncbi:MAG: hypothetical protein ACTSQI_09750 [Candidatus Helarchaeota archaeon]